MSPLKASMGSNTVPAYPAETEFPSFDPFFEVKEGVPTIPKGSWISFRLLFRL